MLETLFKTKPHSIDGRNEKVYSFSEDSESFDFYTDQFKGENSFEIGSGVQKENLNNSPKEMIEVISFLQKNVDVKSIIIELGGSKHQRRSGFPYAFFNNYFPLDISISSITGYSELYDREGIVCDAQNLPLKGNSVDVIYTHTFLEHPIDPDRVVKEIDRVLKHGGLVIHSDAWHCRWWQRFGIYGVKKWEEMTINEKFLNLIIYLNEIKLIRIPIIIAKRILKELFITKKNPQDLIYKKLTPNYDLKIYSDEDAAGSIDPIDVIRFYEQRGYKLIDKKSFLQRIFFNESSIYLKKEGTNTVANKA
jgi:SAM-dependent methyltransferase